MTFQIFLQQLVNGISLGSLYALVAIGYTMVYGVLRLINFAHGDILMVAAYAALFGITIFSLPWWVSFLMVIPLIGLVGIVIDRGAYKPLRKAPRISALITAIGVSFLLENLALVIIGGRPKGFIRPEVFDKVYQISNIRIPSLSIWIPCITIVLLIGITAIIYRTRVGMAMRALSRDMETTRLMGVDIDRVISITFALGSILAAAGGIMWAMKYPQVNPFIGIMPGLKAFVAAVLGGIGNVVGAAIGGFILGVSEILLVAFMPSMAGYRDAFAFVILIAILLFRPTGIMGEALPE